MNHKQIHKLIDDVLWKMGMHSVDAVELVFLTGLVESGYKYISQIGSGIARSFWQVESATAKDCIDNYLIYRDNTFDKCASAMQRKKETILNMNQEELQELLWHDMSAGIVFCRLKYRRDPNSIPKDIDGLAKYWKRVYNTELGAGTLEHFHSSASKRKDK